MVVYVNRRLGDLFSLSCLESVMTWQCDQCGEQHDDHFDQCWNCAVDRNSSAKPSKRSRFSTPNYLLGLKLFACLASGLIGYGVSYGPSGELFNIFSVLFFVSLMCLVPKIGWIAPSIITGFCLGPFLLAPSINGSGAQDINGAIMGAVFGMMFGIVMEFGFLSSAPHRNV